MTLWITHGESFPGWSRCASAVTGRAGLPTPRGEGYFHCVETPNPAAMKPNPTTMFQLPSDSIGSWVSVT